MGLAVTPAQGPRPRRSRARRAVLLLAAIALGAPALSARAAPLPPDGSEPAAAAAPEIGPSLAELQQAALVAARVDPERLASLERRLRAAALLPQLRVRVGRGTGQLLTTTEYDGAARLSVGERDAWQLDVSAAWSLDRLLYHGDELRLLRDAERLAAHRERLLREVAELYTERRRLRLALARARSPAGEPGELVFRLEAVTATLDALCGGALSRHAAPLPGPRR